MNNVDPELVIFAESLADKSRAIASKFFRSKLKIETKDDLSPVTLADKEIELSLRTMINNTYPDHGIIGEEFGAGQLSEYQWIIDPIDGTRSFITGFPIFCSLISLLHNQKPVLSVIDVPILNERYISTINTATRLNNLVLETSKKTELSKAFAYSTSPTMFNEKQFVLQQRLAKTVAEQRYTGDGYSYALLASGWIDLVVEADMKPYDYLPLILIVEKAGGIITDWQGNSLNLESNGEVLAAANTQLHQQALMILNN